MSDLINTARRVREAAYAPYSGYKVGSAIRGVDGKIWSGCNVENLSYGLSTCAERNAVSQMISDGCHEIVEVAVVTKDGGAPCGACLQVLYEFSPDPAKVKVSTTSEAGATREHRLSELMPHGFRSEAVKRTV